jgi:hypothetical protein
MKHVGKMKKNGTPVAVVFRTLPGDPHSCLVVGTQELGPTHHDALMSAIESAEAQTSFELGTILSVRRFPDNTDMLPWLHINKKLVKVPTAGVVMTMTANDTIPLNELNKLIAEQRGVTLEELAIGAPKKDVETTEIATVTELPVEQEVEQPSSQETILDDAALAKKLRSQADAMFKEAQSLRRQADDLDPPAKKTKKTEETV